MLTKLIPTVTHRKLIGCHHICAVFLIHKRFWVDFCPTRYSRIVSFQWRKKVHAKAMLMPYECKWIWHGNKWNYLHHSIYGFKKHRWSNTFDKPTSDKCHLMCDICLKRVWYPKKRNSTCFIMLSFEKPRSAQQILSNDEHSKIGGKTGHNVIKWCPRWSE